MKAILSDKWIRVKWKCSRYGMGHFLTFNLFSRPEVGKKDFLYWVNKAKVIKEGQKEREVCLLAFCN